MTNWPSVNLKDVAKIDRAGIDPTAIVNGTLYLGLEHIQAGGHVLQAQTVSNGELASNKFRFTKRHLLYGKLRPYLAKIALPDFGGICSTDILPVLPGPKLDRSYLAHFLRQPKMVDYANSRSEGASLPRLNPKTLAEFRIPLPPLEEQKRIAAILNVADSLRTKRRASLAKLESLRQSIFIEMFGDPMENPLGFERKKLGEIIDFIGGSQPPKSKFLYEGGPDRVRFVQIRDFRTEEYKTYVPRDLAKRPFEIDDVMIGRYGPPVFQIFRGLSGTYNVALMKADPKAGITKDFVFYLLREPKLHSFVVANSKRTAGQSGVNLTLLESYPAYKPPISLQKQFAKICSCIQKQISTQSCQLNSLEDIFLSLQYRAFRGQL